MYIRVEARCFTRNFMKALRVLFDERDELVANDGTRGTLLKSSLEYFTVRSGAGDMWGIVVGKGTTSPSPDDAWLEQPIQHGDQPNQLFYWETIVSVVEVKESRLRFLVTRVIENRTGSDIQFTEVGLAAKCKLNVSGNLLDKVVLLARDVLQNPVTVPSKGAVRVDYIIYVPL